MSHFLALPARVPLTVKHRNCLRNHLNGDSKLTLQVSCSDSLLLICGFWILGYYVRFAVTQWVQLQVFSILNYTSAASEAPYCPSDCLLRYYYLRCRHRSNLMLAQEEVAEKRLLQAGTQHVVKCGQPNPCLFWAGHNRSNCPLLTQVLISSQIDLRCELTRNDSCPTSLLND